MACTIESTKPLTPDTPVDRYGMVVGLRGVPKVSELVDPKESRQD